MKLFSYYTLALLLVIGLASCRKNDVNITIQQFDQQQIQNYIQQNGLSGMVQDTSGGDTTGIYYKILQVGTGAVIDYPDTINYVYTAKSFDGQYSSLDTIVNHTFSYLGHVAPNGMQLALKNILKRKGTIARLLIPSRLCYGRNGAGSGSNTINGNQCMDFTVHIIDNQSTYDELCIKNYISQNSLTGYSRVNYNNGASFYYYKLTQAGTGPYKPVASSVDSVQYTGYLMNNTIFDQEVTTDGTGIPLTLYSLTAGFKQALALPTSVAGAQMSIIIPSYMGYGNTAQSSTLTTIPSFSCMRFDITVVSVNN